MRPGSPRGWLPDRPSTPAEDLAWDATRYLLDDLDDAAAAAFERRLGRDQAAREALAAAVDLAGAVVLAAREPLPIPALVPAPVLHLPSRRPSAALWRRGVAALAAALLLAVGTWGLGLPKPAGPSGSGRPEAWRIGATWAGIHQGEPGVVSDSDSAPAPEPGDADTEVADVPAERPVPSWMVAAVAVVVPDSADMDMGEMGESNEMDQADSLMDEGD